MTTVTNRSDSLLRLALRIDAVFSGLCGLALIVAAGPLSELTGLPTVAEYAIGATFLVYATAIFLASRREWVRTAGIVFAIANVLFTATTIAVVLARPVELTTAGVVAVLAAGVATLVFADLQYLGVRRIKV